jgi:hypothetical protein
MPAIFTPPRMTGFRSGINQIINEALGIRALTAQWHRTGGLRISVAGFRPQRQIHKQHGHTQGDDEQHCIHDTKIALIGQKQRKCYEYVTDV